MLTSLASRVIILFAIINFCAVIHAERDLLVGPWGGRGGGMWMYEPKGVISQIKVTYDNVVHSICFTSTDENGNLDKSKFSCKQAAKAAEIDIDVTTEKLNGISGTFDNINECTKTITSLSFTTSNNKTYGPFGNVKGTAFSLKVEGGGGISGFYGTTGWLLDNVGVSIGNPSTGNTEDVGEWGNPNGGLPYDYTPAGVIASISIRYEPGEEGSVHGITVTSKDKDGSFSDPTTIGGPGAYYTTDSQVDLDVDNGERLVGISGTYGVYHTYVVVTSLAFYTNKGRSFGPFGAETGTTFSYKGDENKYISGFHGREGGLIDSIGLHIKADFITFGEWGSTIADNAWTYQPNGAISKILINHGVAIGSITFTSIDSNGLATSKKFGKDAARTNSEIDIDPKSENLSGISGTIGTKMGFKFITSLTFSTDNNRTFGPYGTETGTAFSAPLKEGYISGFHGHSGTWLQAIGVYATKLP